jgi:hypothetical protein
VLVSVYSKFLALFGIPDMKSHIYVVHHVYSTTELFIVGTISVYKIL